MKQLITIILLLIVFSSCDESIKEVKASEITLEHYNNLIKADTMLVYTYSEKHNTIIDRGYIMDMKTKTVYEVASVDFTNSTILFLGCVVIVFFIIIMVII